MLTLLQELPFLFGKYMSDLVPGPWPTQGPPPLSVRFEAVAFRRRMVDTPKGLGLCSF